MADILGEPGDDPGRAPEVLHGILYEWVKTTNPPEGEAPVEPYFSGISGFDFSVSLIWRAHISRCRGPVVARERRTTKRCRFRSAMPGKRSVMKKKFSA